jgi:trehalose synthase
MRATAAVLPVAAVSRWDRLKDMTGVMTAFACQVAGTGSAHLVLAGPDLGGVSDDPEGAAQWQACIRLWQQLPDQQQRRIHLAALPVVDVHENALVVNPLQRPAAVVTQKSPCRRLWPHRAEGHVEGPPGGGQCGGRHPRPDEDNRCGLLLSYAADLITFGKMVRRLVDDSLLAQSMRSNAARRAADFLPDRHLTAWAGLLMDAIAC